jgi:parallel beta-helix repeat protein
VYGCCLKGIRMQNSSYIIVDHNYVHDNADHGVDIYMKIMPYLDSHNITVSNNTIVRNQYGILLMGHNCTIRDNLILNSTAR